ncbi:hypothetical protein K439DRAFT_1611074 [Ramaria rubella]|nr:hypothetical protein K439DRAFT_1611074 [Ramaria rubella]
MDDGKWLIPPRLIETECCQAYTVWGRWEDFVESRYRENDSSGHMAISVKRNQFAVDNATDGFDLHQLDNGAHIRTLPTGMPTKKVPKQVAFGEDWEIIVGSSDHGLVYLFERETGRLLNTLCHVDKGLVQTITTHELEGRSAILCASSSNCGNASISLWIRKHPRVRTAETRSRWTLLTIAEAIMKAMMIIATIAFLYQNTDIKDINSPSKSTLPPRKQSIRPSSRNIPSYGWADRKRHSSSKVVLETLGVDSLRGVFGEMLNDMVMEVRINEEADGESTGERGVALLE